MFRMPPLVEGRESETNHPRRHDRHSTQWYVEHATEGHQFTPKTNEQLRRRKWL